MLATFSLKPLKESVVCCPEAIQQDKGFGIPLRRPFDGLEALLVKPFELEELGKMVEAAK